MTLRYLPCSSLSLAARYALAFEAVGPRLIPRFGHRSIGSDGSRQFASEQRTSNPACRSGHVCPEAAEAPAGHTRSPDNTLGIPFIGVLAPQRRRSRAHTEQGARERCRGWLSPRITQRLSLENSDDVPELCSKSQLIGSAWVDRDLRPKAPKVRPTCGRPCSKKPGYAGSMRNTG